MGQDNRRGCMSVLAVPSTPARTGEFERCVYRFAGTGGEGHKRIVVACTHRPSPVLASSLAHSTSQISQEAPSHTSAEKASRCRRRVPALCQTGLLVPRWYPQSDKRTPRTRPDHDARATMVMHTRPPTGPFCFDRRRGFGYRLVRCVVCRHDCVKVVWRLPCPI
jgi:hypothetical protein